MNESRPRPSTAPLNRVDLSARPSALRRNWPWVAGGAGLAVLLAGAFLIFRGGGEEAYVTTPVTKGPLTVTVNASGTLQPRDQVDVGAEISGRVSKVNVDFNDVVTKGQVLVELDTEQLRAKLAQSQASLASARANIRQYEATLEEMRVKAARAEELFKRNAVASQDLETARANAQRAAATLEKSRADAQLAAAQVAVDQYNLTRADIRSPIDGVVLNRQVEPGQAIAASFQTPVLFTLASDLSELELQVDIDEADVGAVKEGQKATFTVDAFPQRHFDASLVSLHNAPKTENGVVTYQGVLLVDNSTKLLRPGLTATAEILVAQEADTLLVPNGALRFLPDQDIVGRAPRPPAPVNGQLGGRVWVLDGRTPVPRDLVIGGSDGTNTQVLNGDIEEGERVITDIENPDDSAGG